LLAVSFFGLSNEVSYLVVGHVLLSFIRHLNTTRTNGTALKNLTSPRLVESFIDCFANFWVSLVDFFTDGLTNPKRNPCCTTTKI
jgi:hypothetical protein